MTGGLSSVDVVRLSKTEVRLLEVATAFGREHVAPYASEWERSRRVPRDCLQQAAQVGLTGILIPVELGGQGCSHLAAVRVLAKLAESCMAFAFSLWVHNNLANAIVKSGSTAHVDRWLSSILRADCIGAFCLTEPVAGSDAAAIETTAHLIDDKWELNGEKAWITNGEIADLFCIYAQTDPQSGWRGIASFLIDADTPGLEKTATYSLMGGHAMGTNGVKLDRCCVPKANLFMAPGAGFKAAMNGINAARTIVAALCCGMLEASLTTALEYGARRRAFGRPTLSFQGLQWELADVATDLEAARLLTEKAAVALDAGEQAIVESAHAKKFASRVALNGISQCMQAMGAAGYRAEFPLARHLATAKMAQYLDGTTEIQNIVISRALLRNHGIETH